jgi:hypothetical protein
MQLGLEVGGLAMGIGCIMVIVTISIVIADFVMTVQLLRRKVAISMAVLIASIGIFASEAYLLLRFSAHDMFEPAIAYFFFAPVVTGLIVLIVAMTQAPTKIQPALIAAAILLAVPIFIMCRGMIQREDLYHAVLMQDTQTAVRLVREGVGSRKNDAAFRQEQFVEAAHNVNPEIVRAFLAAGADPNVLSSKKKESALIDAIAADPVLRYPSIDEKVFPKRRFQTVEVLLERGANPNLVANGVSPAEVAWFHDLPDILALLKQRGSKDADVIGAKFEALVRASASGDLQQVKLLLADPVSKHATDPRNRSPLIEAARNGHTEVVDALLKAYGGYVKCGQIADARDVAAKGNHADTLRRLTGMCGY